MTASDEGNISPPEHTRRHNLIQRLRQYVVYADVAGTLAMAYGFVVAYRAARVGVPAATRAFAPTASGLGIQASGD